MTLQKEIRALAARRRRFVVPGVALLFALSAGLAALSQTPLIPIPVPTGGTIIGEAPAIAAHVNQKEIDRGRVSLAELIRAGNDLFVAAFNTLDGAGRPESNGAGAPGARSRRVFPENFNRSSGPDANACAGCHTTPRTGGGGDNVSNAFVLANARDFSDSIGADTGDERNPPSLFGSGAVEMLGREMTADLQAMKETAVQAARAARQPISLPLFSKGISFGWITALPDGSLDTRRVEGVDSDLVIKPFSQKGVNVSVRQFTVSAFNQHHGMQPSERVGDKVDADHDGKADEITRADVTAATIFQASLPIPGRVIPRQVAVEAAIRKGEASFQQIGCADCHRPALVLNNPVYSEPNPFNPAGNLRPADVARPFTFDLTRDGPGPRLERMADGRAIVRAFTDLKRHRMGDLLNNERLVQEGVPTDAFLTRKLWGVASEPPFLHNGRATTFTEAVLAHGGEAQSARDAFAALSASDRSFVVEFLKSLRILPPGTTALVVDETGRAR
jgi:mono/diheme cytochrome c family protein